MPHGSERRKYIRAEKPFVLNLRIKPNKSRKATSTGWNMVSADNLSAGGISLYYIKNLKIGSLVDLRISIPESTTSICCTGEIIRSKKNPKFTIYETAISFKETSEQEREMINKIIKENLWE